MCVAVGIEAISGGCPNDNSHLGRSCEFKEKTGVDLALSMLSIIYSDNRSTTKFSYS